MSLPAATDAPHWVQALTVTTAEQTHALGAALAEVLRAGDLLVLTGELGAGKTTFTQGLGEGLGVREGIISPTFVLVRIHPNLPDGPRPGGTPFSTRESNATMPTRSSIRLQTYATSIDALTA